MSDSAPDRPERWGPWLLEAWIPVGTFFLVVLAVAVALAQRCEPALRYCSAALQVVVIITVIIDIKGKRKHTDRETARERSKAWWRRAPWRRWTASGDTAGAGGLKVRVRPATATGLMDPNASTSDRLTALEAAAEALRNDLIAFKGATDTALSAVNERLDEETAARKEGDLANRKRSDEGLAGGIDLSMASVAVLTVGLVLGTAANNFTGACRLW